jgi:hypothetical protein
VFAPRKFRIETAIVFDDSPVGREPATSIRAIFFGGFRGDANEDPSCQRTGHIGGEIGGELPAEFADSDKFPLRDSPN